MDDSRRRSVLIIAATIFVGASLGYIYSYSRSNRLLSDKHASLTYNFNLCSGKKRKCTEKLDACLYSGSMLQESEKKLKALLSTARDNVAEHAKSLDTARSNLGKVYKNFFDVARALEVADQKDDNGNNILTADLLTAVSEKIDELKRSNMEYASLKPKYEALQSNFTALSGEKDTLSQSAQTLGTEKKTIAASLDELTKEKASLLQAQQDLTKQVQDLEQEKNTLQASLSEMLKPKKRTGDAKKIEKIIESEKATTESIEQLVNKIDKNSAAVKSTSQTPKKDTEEPKKENTGTGETKRTVQGSSSTKQVSDARKAQENAVQKNELQTKVAQPVTETSTQSKVGETKEAPSTPQKVVQPVTESGSPDKTVIVPSKEGFVSEVKEVPGV